MKLIFVFTAIVAFFVNLPLIYNMIFVYKFSGLKDLWGFAPNALLFYLVPFPAAFLLSSYALYVFLGELRRMDFPNTGLAGLIVYDWILIVLCILALGVIVTAGDYWNGTRTFEKLQHPHALKAAECLMNFNKKLATDEEYEREHKKIITQARDNVELLKPRIQGLPLRVRSEEVATLPPVEYLLIVQDGSLQRNFGLLDESINSLTVFQTLLLITVLSLLCTAVFIWHCAIWHIGVENVTPLMKNGLFAFYIALLSIFFYPFFYWIQHVEIERIVLERPSILPHILITLVLILLFMLVKYKDWMIILSGGYRAIIPFIFRCFLASVFVGIAVKSHSFLSKLFGIQSNMGTQITVIVLMLLGYGIAAFHLVLGHNGD